MNPISSWRTAVLVSAVASGATISLAAERSAVFPNHTWQTKMPRDVRFDVDKLNEFAGSVGGDLFGSRGGGGSDQNFPGQGVYGFNWWFNAKTARGDEMFLPYLPDDAFCTIGHQGNEVMLIVPSWGSWFQLVATGAACGWIERSCSRKLCSIS